MVGFLALRYRLKGAYFALSTFAFAEMLRLLATNSDFVNRAVGYNVPLRREFSWGFMQFAPGAPEYFWIALGLTVVALAVSILFLGSKLGRFTIAVRDDEEAAAALGIPVMRTKLLTIALSAAITSVAGTFYAQYYFFVDPDGAFGPSVSIQAILPAVIGGVGTIWGPAIGALVLGPLNDITATLLRNPPPALDFLQGRAGLDVIVYALLLILIVLLLPQGVYGALRDGCDAGEPPARGTRQPILPRSQSGGRRLLHRRGGHHPGHHRPQRRRQDDPVQPRGGCDSPGHGHSPLGRPRRHRAGALPRLPGRHGPDVPAHEAVRSVSVLENVAVAAMAAGTTRHDADRVAADVVERVGISRWRDVRSSSLPTAGLKRLELARALAGRPRVLLLDEVLAGLVPSERTPVMELLEALRPEDGVTLVFVEHIMAAVMRLSDSVLVLDQGRVLISGSPDEVTKDPRVIEAYLGEEPTGAAS